MELGTRNIKLALRRLRQFAREGAELELDLPDTVRSTANNAGWLDLKMVPERLAALSLLRDSLRQQKINRHALRDLHGYFGENKK